MQHRYVKDYATAAAWLKGGRKKYDRPLYSRGLRLQYRTGNRIAVVDRWSGTDILYYHPDDTMTIQAPTVTTAWGSQYSLLRSQSVRLVLAEYAGFQNLYVKNGKARILEYGHNNTPPKIQKCRSCSGLGKQKAWCTPVTCWNDPCKYPDRPVLNANKYRNWHEHSCEHGNHKMHKIYTENDCYRCGGAGKADYGSKPIAMMWDGSPLRIKHGKIINNQPTELEKAIAAYVKTG